MKHLNIIKYTQGFQLDTASVIFNHFHWYTVVIFSYFLRLRKNEDKEKILHSNDWSMRLLFIYATIIYMAPLQHFINLRTRYINTCCLCPLGLIGYKFLQMERKRKVMPRSDGKSTLTRVVQRHLDSSQQLQNSPKRSKGAEIESLSSERFNSFRR